MKNKTILSIMLSLLVSFSLCFSSFNISTAATVAKKPLYSKVLVAIDAGHGGSDGGACANGIREENINLAVALKVNKKLRAYGFKTIMTRSKDTNVSINNRWKKANNSKADLFVSIHSNGASNKSAYGIETLYRQSKTFAQLLQNNIISTTKAKSRGLKKRTNLGVINYSKMPTALVELGFVTNAKEAKNLNSNSYQEKLANGIVKGIIQYTNQKIRK